VPLSLPFSALSLREDFKSRDKLRGHQGSSEFSEEPPLPVAVLLCQSQSTSVTSLFLELGCCYKQHEIDKKWHKEKLKGHFCFLMLLTPVFTRKKTAFISILLGSVEGE
jgi:hypothetical protein